MQVKFLIKVEVAAYLMIIKMNMKKLFTVIAAMMAVVTGFSQDNEENIEKGFNINNMFVGGSVGLGYTGGNGSSFSIGAFPQVGYSFNNWFDAGLSFNANLNTLKYYDGQEITVKSFNYGAGVFARAYPFGGFFLQAQPEYNWISYKSKGSMSGSMPKQTVHAPSLLVGAGFGQRIIGQTSYFTSIMVDLSDNPNSPYRDGYNNMIPVIRAGINVYLKPRQRD